MSHSRRGKATPPPAPAPQPRLKSGLWARLLDLLQKKPVETLGAIGALLTALGGLVIALGFVTLRAREALLGLSPGLTYPKQEWLFTGFHALGALFWRGLSVLVADHSSLKGCAWALVAIIAALVLAARAKRRPALLLGALTLSTLLLGGSTAFYRRALPTPAGASQGVDCGTSLSANLADRAAFETCSWLVNDTAQNTGRRNDFGGLLAWLLAACGTGTAAGALIPIQDWRLARGARVLTGAHVLLGLLLLYELPRTHAFATWGLRYPQVRLREGCDAELAKATTEGTSCWAFDVSAGAAKRTVFLRGAGCPAGRDGTFLHLGSAETDGSECLATLSSARVILHGPNP